MMILFLLTLLVFLSFYKFAPELLVIGGMGLILLIGIILFVIGIILSFELIDALPFWLYGILGILMYVCILKYFLNLRK